MVDIKKRFPQYLYQDLNNNETVCRNGDRLGKKYGEAEEAIAYQRRTDRGLQDGIIALKEEI